MGVIRNYDWYLFKRWLKAFLMTLCVTSVLLLMERVSDDLWDLLTYGATLRESVLYFLWIMPRGVPTLLPAAVLISVLLVLVQMHSKREIVALRAAGLGIFSITRSLWCAGVLCAAALFVLNGWVIPASIDSANLLMRNLKFRAAENAGEKSFDVGAIDQLAFANESAGRLWFFDQFSTRSYTAAGAHLYQIDADRKLVAHTEAREAYFDDTREAWTFVDGSRLYYAQAGRAQGMRIETFESWTPEHYPEHPETMLALSRRPKDLSFDSLRSLINTEELSANPALAPYRAHMNQLLVSPVMACIVVGLAIPFALRGVRTNPMVGVSQVLFVFFFYYLLINAFTVLGGREVLSAQLSAWAPHGLMGIVAALLNIFRQ